MSQSPSIFGPRGDDSAVEGGLQLSPKFDDSGLIPCITTDADSGEVLMLAWMNAPALAETIATGKACYYSRSRQRLWRKGEESGNVQAVVELLVDCDQDTIWLKVRTAGQGAACHTGRRSCFYRALAPGAETGAAGLRFVGDDPLFDPSEIYGKRD